MHDQEFIKLVDAAWSSYAKAEAMFRRSLDAKTDRMHLIGKAIAARNAALDRYEEAVERQSAIKALRIEPKRSSERKEASSNAA